MNNLSKFGVQELNAQEVKNVQGGNMIVDLFALAGSAFAWAFDKGQALGEAMAKN